MRDYIGDKRSQLMKFVRAAVTLEFASCAEKNSALKQAFWLTLLEEHAVLSPDPAKVNI
jgi:hypothetical protein